MTSAIHAPGDSSDVASADAPRGDEPRADEPGAELASEFGEAWRRGACSSLEEFLAQRPSLKLAAAAAVQLVCEEIWLRQEAGESIESAEILRRFPQWRAELELLLACYGLFEDEAEAEFPVAGDELGDFRLLAELGRGANGRVFLASQPSLSDRPVVVKFAPFEAAEHLSLSRLQHTGIVPLYLVQDFPERGLRALCMPYWGGASLDALLDLLRESPPGERSGAKLVEALDRLRERLPASAPFEGPALEWLASLSYVQAVCWIGASLAEALHYAHQRDLLHLDVKPSNVLVAGDGQPMLLDFHLARAPLRPGAAGNEWLGGTQGYMSPEQASGVAAIRAGRQIASAVDARSDVYSLGVVLYEMLGGPAANPAANRSANHSASSDAVSIRPAIRDLNSAVSPGLADLLDKCLARDPAARYRDAASLADDLRRHLDDLPLRGAPNRSLVERWQKWRRRTPLALGRISIGALAAIALVGGSLAYVDRQVQDAQLDLQEGDKLVERGEFPAAVDRLRAGAARLARVPGHVDLKGLLAERLAAAERNRLVEDLHRLVDRLRYLESGVDSPGAMSAEIDEGCRKIWSARDEIVAELSRDESTDATDETRADLLDLGLLWAGIKYRAARTSEEPQARAAALRTLDEAAQSFGDSFVLAQERTAYEANAADRDRQPNTKIEPEDAEPRSVWEHYAFGRLLLRQGRLDDAAQQFRVALQKAPQAFWPNYDSGVCAFRAGRHADALTAFSVCVALAPTSAECFYNRGLAHAALDQFDDAIADYTSALELNPKLATAALHRGVLHRDAKRFQEAAADFERALENGADPAAVHYQLALLHLARGDRTAAEASVRKSLEHSPEDPEARSLLQRLE